MDLTLQTDDGEGITPEQVAALARSVPENGRITAVRVSVEIATDAEPEDTDTDTRQYRVVNGRVIPTDWDTSSAYFEVAEVLAMKPDKWFTPEELTEATGMSRKIVTGHASSLVNKGVAERERDTRPTRNRTVYRYRDEALHLFDLDPDTLGSEGSA